MSEGLILAITLIIGLGVAIVLIESMVRAIQQERRSSRVSRLWANFGLSISFLALFLIQLDRPGRRRMGHLRPGRAGAR